VLREREKDEHERAHARAESLSSQTIRSTSEEPPQGQAIRSMRLGLPHLPKGVSRTRSQPLTKKKVAAMASTTARLPKTTKKTHV
jgi:hypothetical protein